VKIPSSIWTLLIGILLTLVSLWYGQNNGLLPVAATDEALLIDGLFNTMMVISVAIFLLVQGVLIYSIIKYRRRAGDDTDGPPVHGNVPLEILWTAVPAIIVLGISVYSFEVYNDIGGFDPHGGHDAPLVNVSSSVSSKVNPKVNKSGIAFAATLADDHTKMEHQMGKQIAQLDGAGMEADTKVKPADVHVNIMGIQYAFIFSYPDTGVSSGELHVPIGKKTEVTMTGSDVIHAFWVPEFRIKQDIIPGRETKLSFTPKVEGDYALICAELCGPYHGAMRTHVIVEPQEAYDKWTQEQLVAQAETLNQAVAYNPVNKSTDEFLTPYVREMGIQPEVLHQVHK